MKINFSPILSNFKVAGQFITKNPMSISIVTVAVAAIAIFALAVYKLVQHYRKTKVKNAIVLDANSTPASSVVNQIPQRKQAVNVYQTGAQDNSPKPMPKSPVPPTPSIDLHKTGAQDNTPKQKPKSPVPPTPSIDLHKTGAQDNTPKQKPKSPVPSTPSTKRLNKSQSVENFFIQKDSRKNRLSM